MMRPDVADNIEFLSGFKADIQAYFDGAYDESVRSRINRGMRRAKTLVAETGSNKAVTLSPPPMIGGFVVRNADPFSYILQDYYGMSLIPTVCDMIEQAIGVLEDPHYSSLPAATQSDAQHPGRSLSRFSLRRLQKTVSVQVPAARREPELPEKVTLSWLVKHVPISLWIWFTSLLAAALALGVKVAEYLPK